MNIKIWRMLVGCSVVFCIMSMWITITFPDHTLELLSFFAYITISCTFIPLPTPQVIMDFGQRFGPASIAMIGGIAFCISALIDYSLVTFVFRYERVNRIKATRTYSYVSRFFDKSPFAILVVAAFTPIPVDPVKLVACAARYNRFKYILACFVGRAPRYYLLGVLQTKAMIPRKYLYGSILVLVATGIIRELIKRQKGKQV